MTKSMYVICRERNDLFKFLDIQTYAKLTVSPANQSWDPRKAESSFSFKDSLVRNSGLFFSFTTKKLIANTRGY